MTYEQSIRRNLAYLSGFADALTDTYPNLAELLGGTVCELESDIFDAIADAAANAVEYGPDADTPAFTTATSEQIEATGETNLAEALADEPDPVWTTGRGEYGWFEVRRDGLLISLWRPSVPEEMDSYERMCRACGITPLPIDHPETPDETTEALAAISESHEAGYVNYGYGTSEAPRVSPTIDAHDPNET